MVIKEDRNVIIIVIKNWINKRSQNIYFVSLGNETLQQEYFVQCIIILKNFSHIASLLQSIKVGLIEDGRIQHKENGCSNETSKFK